MHVITFDIKEDVAMKETKLLAFSVEDTRKTEYADVTFHALLYPPPEPTERFDNANAILESAGCEINNAKNELTPFVEQLRNRLRRD